MRVFKVVGLLAIVGLCLFSSFLNTQSGLFREIQAALLSVDWMLLTCLALWSATFIFLTFSRKDWPLIGLLLIAMTEYFISFVETSQAADAAILLASVTFGKGVCFLLNRSNRRESTPTENPEVDQSGLTVAATFLIGIVGLQAFSAWWHLEVAHNFYPGTRWTGLWDNPNIYGMLMGAGGVLAIGLLAAKAGKLKAESGNQNPILRLLRFFVAKTAWFLGIAVFMLGVGLVMSYSRGAWLATTLGLLYLAWCYGKLKWRWVLPVMLAATAVVIHFWHSTAVNSPWYLKRLDFSRPSAQHRVVAWKAGIEIMRDHPFGVGWNKSVEVYDKDYSPPVNGAGAITMNSYLMLGTELGLPGMLCFVAYVGLCISNRELRISKSRPHLTLTRSVLTAGNGAGISIACRAGALVLLVAFWFDGGLFDLPTGTVFWILLELSQIRNAECGM